MFDAFELDMQNGAGIVSSGGGGNVGDIAWFPRNPGNRHLACTNVTIKQADFPLLFKRVPIVIGAPISTVLTAGYGINGAVLVGGMGYATGQNGLFHVSYNNGLTWVYQGLNFFGAAVVCYIAQGLINGVSYFVVTTGSTNGSRIFYSTNPLVNGWSESSSPTGNSFGPVFYIKTSATTGYFISGSSASTNMSFTTNGTTWSTTSSGTSTNAGGGVADSGTGKILGIPVGGTNNTVGVSTNSGLAWTSYQSLPNGIATSAIGYHKGYFYCSYNQNGGGHYRTAVSSTGWDSQLLVPTTGVIRSFYSTGKYLFAFTSIAGEIWYIQSPDDVWKLKPNAGRSASGTAFANTDSELIALGNGADSTYLPLSATPLLENLVDDAGNIIGYPYIRALP